MAKFLFVLVFLTFISCGPRPQANLNILMIRENQGLALPVHALTVDESLRIELENATVEEWMVGEKANTMTGISRRVLRQAEAEFLAVSRTSGRNDIMLLVDFPETDSQDRQKLFIGKKYYQAKNIYILVDRERVRIVEKETFDDYLNRRRIN
jgi:hypothetical protein